MRLNMNFKINKNRNYLEEYKEYHFFYGGPLSNWASYSFVDTRTGDSYNCSEQFMMHKKALLFSDYNTAGKIMNKEYPGDQKALGRMVAGFDASIWNEHARDIVYEGCYYKFTQNKEAYDYLMETEGYLLVEASPTDTIWGIGLGGYDPDIQDSKNWRGTNWLGEVLTQLREDLKGKPELVLF